MKLTVGVVLFTLALSLCNLTGKRSNNNANSNAAPGEIAESSPTPAEVPTSPTPDAATSNRNTNASLPDLRSVRPPATPEVQRDLRAAPSTSAPGAPPSSAPAMNSNSAARVPPRPPTTISGGVLNGKATHLPKPTYPAIAKAANVSGVVNVQVTVDENGNVISASAVSGHPLLRQSAVSAARGAKFRPTMLNGQPVRVTGVITYNFVAQ